MNINAWSGRGRRPAFTLIELLVVLSIISLLIAILLPALAKARESSQRTLCLANVRGFALAMEIYANDRKEWYLTDSHHRSADYLVLSDRTAPIGSAPVMPTGGGDGVNSVNWRTLQGYGVSLKALSCPSGAYKAGIRSAATGGLSLNYFYHAGRGDRRFTGSAYNDGDWQGYNDYDTPNIGSRAEGYQPILRRSNMKRPINVVIFTDLIRGVNSRSAGPGLTISNMSGGSTSYNIEPNHVVQSDPLLLSEGGNIAFGDGSAKWKNLDAMVERYNRQWQTFYY